MRDSILRAISTGGVTTPPTRQEIRDYIAQHVIAVKAHAAAGGNPHQMLLDHSDQLNQFAALLPDQAMRDEFMRIYTEELAAATEGVKREVEQKESEQIASASRNRTIMAALAFIAMIVAIVVLMQAFA